MDNNKYFVSRQNYSAIEGNMREVEIAIGGAGAAGADMLPTSFPGLGEGYEFNDPREALKAARFIWRAWVAVNHEIDVSVIIPTTNLVFHPPSNPLLDAWAQAEYEKLVKCDRCGKITDGDPYVLFDVDDVRFCSSVCAKEYHQENTEWAWCSRCDNDTEATHVLNYEDVEIFLCDHCASAFELGQAYPKTTLEVL